MAVEGDAAPAGGRAVPRRAAVLGSPVSHSLSPALHRAAYAALGLPWTYDAVEVLPEQLPGFLAGLDASWAGLSLTMPLKRAVLPLLDTVSDLARTVGAANTVVLAGGPAPSGRPARHGHNTDVAGIVLALRGAGVDAPPRTATVLGGGATARSALAALAGLGAARVVVCVRRAQAGAELVALGRDLGVAVAVHPWSEAGHAGHDAAPVLRADVVVSTAPRGACDRLAADVPARPGALLDVVYHPWPTPLAAAWRGAGGRLAGGHDMLLWQAAEQVQLMTGLPAPVSAMRAALAAG